MNTKYMYNYKMNSKHFKALTFEYNVDLVIFN